MMAYEIMRSRLISRDILSSLLFESCIGYLNMRHSVKDIKVCMVYGVRRFRQKMSGRVRWHVNCGRCM